MSLVRIVLFFIFINQHIFAVSKMCWNPLSKAVASTNGFYMSFVQEDSYTFIKGIKKADGLLIASPPLKFIWRIYGDNAGIITSNGKKVWFYTPAEDKGDEDTLMEKDYSEAGGVASILLSCNKINLASVVRKGRFIKVYLKGDSSKGYRWATLKFTEKPFKLQQIEFENINNSKTKISVLSFVILKEKPDQSLFEFKRGKKGF